MEISPDRKCFHHLNKHRQTLSCVPVFSIAKGMDMMRKGITSKTSVGLPKGAWPPAPVLADGARPVPTGACVRPAYRPLHLCLLRNRRMPARYYHATAALRAAEHRSVHAVRLPAPVPPGGPEETPGERMMIYTLRKPERQLVAAFRMLLPEKQARAFRALARMGILTGTDRETPPDP